ncbi:hypothetical protein BDZ90DRAFT_104553 [Jaminaea rosea]|uniref:DASH complex subunit DAD1 n=1 Tax=Jaminaea rosea TaxID=1569628 RepID=A0A316UY94_9BASI|nr:hypothetical protein BDZ90DRAFT_104553 [Jaminaea rosea]PWN29281.1 hypothetical protein BDZ90DRAFT_104553 [Jaminaea rosea]
MSRTRTPSPPPALQSSSGNHNNKNGIRSDGNTAQSAGTAFFLRERQRLVAEIAESIGQILNHSNALNRKLEESLLVGHEFEPVARLWGNFAASMGGSLDPSNINSDTQQQQQQHHDDNGGDDTVLEHRDEGAQSTNQASSGDALSQSQAGQTQAQAPGQVPVAPGGGNWSTVA